MPRPANNPFRTPIGQAALHAECGPALPPPAVQSFSVSGARRTVFGASHIEEYYPPKYQTEGTLRGNLRFALKNEPLDLGVIYAALNTMGAKELEAWTREEPTGAFSRRAWFLYETLTGKTLDLEPARTGGYVDALNEESHFTAAALNSPRHRVRDNLLGTGLLCPVLRKTPKLLAQIEQQYDEKIKALAENYPPRLLARAVNFLYTKETRSSFAIEGETPTPQREERFVNVLHSLSSFTPDKEGLIHLQRAIVEPRYAAQDWRSIQNFVGEWAWGSGEKVHFICPRPQDVPSLIEGWMALTDRLLTSEGLDAVLAAAVSSFAFVFIHPFEDGNGRLHRYLMHYALNRRGFSPPGFIFPVSAAILRERLLYDKTLETFSRPLFAAIDWFFTAESALVVQNDTHDLYRFFDATGQAEFIYDRVAETTQIDFKEELDFLVGYDAAFSAVQRIVDMPDRKIGLLIRLIVQNGYRLSHNKRPQFSELSEDEVERMEEAIKEAMSQRTSVINRV